jgi:cytochrome c-type biogenesis protein CcmF
MIAFMGHLFLLSALFISFLQWTLPLYGYYRNNIYLLSTARVASYAQILCVIGAYGLLTFAFITNDFSIRYVAAHAHATLPFIYKLTAVWGGHEGSILLWILILNVWTIIFTLVGRSINISNELFQLTIALFGGISLCFLLFLLLTSNPFLPATLSNVPADLNPLLQDPGFLVHPPMLYVGYVGFSSTFAITLAALICRQMNDAWIKLINYFAMLAWIFLTLGILLGSWWAYRVLGWGGFWFWDPVENISLLPWLCGLALIHVLKLCHSSARAKEWATLLSLLCFALSLMGTLLVRSGVLISAHTFASDPARGIFLLLMLSLLSCVAFFIFYTRMPLVSNQPSPRSVIFFSHDKSLWLNSGLLFIALLTILLGTLYPLIINLFSQYTLSVGAPYFNTVMLPLVIVILFFMTWSALQRLRSVSNKNNAMRLAHSGFVILIAGILLGAFYNQERDVRLQPGQAAFIGHYQLFFNNTETVQGANYRGIRADVEVLKGIRHIAFLHPEKRIYTVSQNIMTHVAIHAGLFNDLYIALGEPLDRNYWSLRLYYKPFIHFIWLGAILMMLGGIFAMMKNTVKWKQP